MSRLALPAAAAASLTVLASAPLSAATLLEVTTPTAPTPSGTDIEYMFDAGAGDGMIDLIFDGYGTIDGDGSRLSDVFTIALNGTDIFSGSYRLGGGGSDVTFLSPTGAVITPADAGRANGGTLSIMSPLTFVDGSNTLTFSFAGTGSDELFGVQNLLVTGPMAVAVPEPETWAMLILGFLGVGFALRRTRRMQHRVRVS